MTTHNLEATVKARVSRQTAAALVKAANADRRNVSDVVRIAIDEYLQRQGGKR
jgi:uncharacterized protein (DUF1778 family)